MGLAGSRTLLLSVDLLGKNLGLSRTVSCISFTHTDRRLLAHTGFWKATAGGSWFHNHSEVALREWRPKIRDGVPGDAEPGKTAWKK